ncbi:MAG TPA: hypothetical protein VMN58_01160 [Acidimicrobiales bacterium]|nr:hypothetical protein [Acidimicrobiales bacterium]
MASEWATPGHGSNLDGRTGTRYAIPVQALAWHGELVVLTLRRRIWWRNLRARPALELLLRGERIPGHATVADGERARAVVADCLEENPRVAKFYGVELGPRGAIDDATLDKLVEMLAVIVIDPGPEPAG